MNVYDSAHELARAISASEEFKQYDEARIKVSEHAEIEKMIKDFQGKQMELQAKQMMGEELDENYIQELTQISAIVMQDPLAADYMTKEMRFAMMMQDVYGIIGEAIGAANPLG